MFGMSLAIRGRINLTLQDALKTGKHFRRPGKIWREPLGPELGELRTFSEEDLLAMDWETDQRNIMITLQELRAAYMLSHRQPINYIHSQKFNDLARELGFEEDLSSHVSTL